MRVRCFYGHGWNGGRCSALGGINCHFKPPAFSIFVDLMADIADNEGSGPQRAYTLRRLKFGWASNATQDRTPGENQQHCPMGLHPLKERPCTVPPPASFLPSTPSSVIIAPPPPTSETKQPRQLAKARPFGDHGGRLLGPFFFRGVFPNLHKF